MFTSLMRVLHEMLPCSKNFFNMKRKYRQSQAEDDDGNRSDNRKVREIASPRIVRGLSLHKSPSRRLSSRGASIGSTDGFSRFQGLGSDVRVKRNVNPEIIRNSSRKNSGLISAAEGSFLPELNNNSSRGDARTAMGASPTKKMIMQSKIRGKNAAPNLAPLDLDN